MGFFSGILSKKQESAQFDLASLNIIDIHSHIIPGVDDGSKDTKQTLEMLRMAHREGVSVIIATPHNYPHRKTAEAPIVREKLEEIKKLIKKEDIPIEIYGGNELYFRHDLANEIDDGKACTLAGTSYILVEFDPSDHFTYIRDGLNELGYSGYKPVLAHAERYLTLHKKSPFYKEDKVDELIRMGVYIQVNSGSIMGDFGNNIARFSEYLLSGQKVHFLGTDAHSDENRAPRMINCARYLIKKHGMEYAKLILRENALTLIEGKRVPPYPFGKEI